MESDPGLKSDVPSNTCTRRQIARTRVWLDSPSIPRVDRTVICVCCRSEGYCCHVGMLCTSNLNPMPSTILLIHQYLKHIMSSIEDPKQLSLRTGQLSNNALGINAPPSPAHKSAPAEPSVHYTCFIRLPFARGDFVDPPQVFCMY
jgi:hypothetical protein